MTKAEKAFTEFCKQRESNVPVAKEIWLAAVTWGRADMRKRAEKLAKEALKHATCCEEEQDCMTRCELSDLMHDIRAIPDEEEE